MMRESLQQYADGPTAAVYSASAHNPFFPAYIRANLIVRVERQIGRRPLRWMATVDLELPDEGRTYWGERIVCGSQDEAATEAAALLLTARPLFEASLRGESVETPGQRRVRAAKAHVEALPAYVAAMQRVSMLRAARRELDIGSSEHPAAHRRYLDAKAEAETLHLREIEAFREVHGWREFAV